MRLRKPCEHGKYDVHDLRITDSHGWLIPPFRCPGGEFLVEGVLVIERDPDGMFPTWITDVDGPVWYQCGGTANLLEDIYDALSVREGKA